MELGVLEAEASFRAGDFRNAADAYAALLRERPVELEAARLASLIYMRVLAEIRSGSGEAAKVLDEVERDPVFDVENRWQAEWSLARDLQLAQPRRVPLGKREIGGCLPGVRLGLAEVRGSDEGERGVLRDTRSRGGDDTRNAAGER